MVLTKLAVRSNGFVFSINGPLDSWHDQTLICKRVGTRKDDRYEAVIIFGNNLFKLSYLFFVLSNYQLLDRHYIPKAALAYWWIWTFGACFAA